MTGPSAPIEFVAPPSNEEGLGRCIALCCEMDVYLRWNLWDIGRLFIPPILADQMRMIQVDGRDVGFFTWAQLSNCASNFVEKRHADPRPYEWTSGPELWIIDNVCKPEFARRAALAIQRDVFNRDFIERRGLDIHTPARALRRNPDKSVRKIAIFPYRWVTERAA